MKNLKFVGLLSVLILAGCGGGSTGGQPTNTSAPSTPSAEPTLEPTSEDFIKEVGKEVAKGAAEQFLKVLKTTEPSNYSSSATSKIKETAQSSLKVLHYGFAVDHKNEKIQANIYEGYASDDSKLISSNWLFSDGENYIDAKNDGKAKTYKVLPSETYEQAIETSALYMNAQPGLMLQLASSFVEKIFVEGFDQEQIIKETYKVNDAKDSMLISVQVNNVGEIAKTFKTSKFAIHVENNKLHAVSVENFTKDEKGNDIVASKMKQGFDYSPVTVNVPTFDDTWVENK